MALFCTKCGWNMVEDEEEVEVDNYLFLGGPCDGFVLEIPTDLVYMDVRIPPQNDPLVQDVESNYVDDEEDCEGRQFLYEKVEISSTRDRVFLPSGLPPDEQGRLVFQSLIRIAKTHAMMGL